MTKIPRLFLLPMILSFGGSTDAHHAFARDYDGKRIYTVEGVVREFKFIDPHTKLLIEVMGQNGDTVQWTAELAGRFNLARAGWTEQTIKPGERVTVTGNPTHTSSTRLAFIHLVKADGTKLVHGFIGPPK
jgi:hypothetical protein